VTLSGSELETKLRDFLILILHCSKVRPNISDKTGLAIGVWHEMDSDRSPLHVPTKYLRDAIRSHESSFVGKLLESSWALASGIWDSRAVKCPIKPVFTDRLKLLKGAEYY
jgi:hypothetical protein